MKKVKAQADIIQKLDDLKRGTILYKIASAMITAKGYYTYTDFATGNKCFVS